MAAHHTSGMPIDPWLPRAAAQHPERIALEAPEGALTYAAAARGGADRRRARRPGRARARRPAWTSRSRCTPACWRAPPRCRSTRGWGRPSRRRCWPRRTLVVDGAAAARRRRGAAWRRATATRRSSCTRSGTTAAPRPVELSFGNVQANALGSAVALGLDPDERWLCPLPLSHVGGLMVLLRSAIYGTRAVLDERRARVRRRHHGRLARPDPAAAAAGRGRAPGRAPARGPAGRRGGHARPARGGARGRLARPRHLRAHAGLLAGRGRRPAAARPGGRARRRRRDPRRGPDRRRRRRPAHGRPRPLRPRTGGWRSSAASSDTIVTGGENVAPAEVEAALLAHPAVADAGVFGRPDPEWGEAVTASVVLRAPADPQELREWVAGRLARFKVPEGGRGGGGASAQRIWEAAAPGAAMSEDIRQQSRARWTAMPRRAGSAHGEHAAPGHRCPSRPGWSTRSARSRATRCSSWPPAPATPASSPPS